jgi:hypothetical protein
MLQIGELLVMLSSDDYCARICYTITIGNYDYSIAEYRSTGIGAYDIGIIHQAARADYLTAVSVVGINDYIKTKLCTLYNATSHRHNDRFQRLLPSMHLNSVIELLSSAISNVAY